VRISTAAIVLLAISLPAAAANAQASGDEVAELRQMILEMRDDYERRISELEARLDIAEREARVAKRDAGEAFELAEEASIQQSSGSSAPNTFNPSIGVVLDGGFADVGAGWEEIPGFQPAGEIGTGESGFSPGEVEINLKANVDTRYFGNVTFALAEEDGEVEVEFEEAWVQTTALPAGFTVMGGRFFSESGYLNDFHFHADDFVDRPLPYQAFYGGRYTVDGIQARWVAPTSLLFEVGTELNWGGSFPATGNAETSPGAWTLFTKIGGDIGASNSWQLGLSHVSADAMDRAGGHEGEEEGGLFSGDSDLTVLDFVWKWAPLGNPNVNNFKLQGEYFMRSEDGTFADLPYDGDQEGWYLQGVPGGLVPAGRVAVCAGLARGPPARHGGRRQRAGPRRYRTGRPRPQFAPLERDARLVAERIQPPSPAVHRRPGSRGIRQRLVPAVHHEHRRARRAPVLGARS
jgi:hypothetical protein